MTDKDELSVEHLALLQEASQLQINTLLWDKPDANLDALREAIARQTEALAKEAIIKRRLERAAMDESDLAAKGAFDEVMGETRGVLVRVTEWTEWIPLSKSPHLSALSLANGVTGLEAGENERLLSVEAIGTQRVKTIDIEDGTVAYMCYAFKATLAQNVHTTLITTLVEAQGSNAEGEEQRPQAPARIITPDGPNRQQRRHPNG